MNMSAESLTLNRPSSAAADAFRQRGYAVVPQVFLHYVDRDGQYAGEKFDWRKTLMRPKQVGRGDGNHGADKLWVQSSNRSTDTGRSFGAMVRSQARISTGRE